MTHHVIMPKLGETMEEGYLVSWKKEEGAKVAKGEVLFEVMSDKTNFEVEALQSGFLRKKLYEPSETAIPVTAVIGYITDTLEEEVVEQAEKKEPVLPKAVEEKPAVSRPEAEPQTDAERIRISPLARKLARELGIDIKAVQGSGPGGRIEKKDILDYQAGRPAPSGYTVKPWTPLRRIIAERLSLSKATIPHYYLQGKAVMDGVVNLKEERKKAGFDFSYTDFIFYFCGRVLKEYPLLNAALIDDQIRVYDSVDIGLAVAVEDGLIVPVLRRVDEKSLGEISEEIKALTTRARAGQLKKEDLEGCRFVISNLGMFGVDNFLPIINPPAVAIMGVAALEKVPLVRNDQVGIHYVLHFSLSLDHRIVDGAYAGQFIRRFKEIMENPG